MGLTTTKEWRWDAPGAHTLTGAVGSARILLRDFLLECGWSVIWEDAGAQKVVLRNSQAHGGSGCYVRILDDGSFTGGSRVARIDVYEAMTDIDTGTAHASGGWIWKDRTGSGGPNAFTVHGDQRTCYLTTYVNGGTPPVVAGVTGRYHVHTSGFGDYVASNPGDPGVFCASGENESPGTSTTTSDSSGLVRNNNSATAVPTTFGTSRAQDLTVASTAMVILNPATSNNTNVGIGDVNACLISTPESPGVGGIHVLPAVVLGDGGIYGRMRGLYVPLNNCSAATDINVGNTRSPINTTRALDLAVLAASWGSSFGRLFVERTLSWDGV